MSDAIDRLIRAFWRAMPDRVTECTELLLGAEQGQEAALRDLRRTLHGIKGEAQMLGFADCSRLAQAAENAVHAIGEAGAWPEEVSNTLLAAFERFAMLDPELTIHELSSVDDLCELLEQASQSLTRAPSVPADDAPPEIDDLSVSEGAVPAGKAQAARVVAVDSLEPVASELRRLYGEQAVLYPQLRELQTMLRTLLRQIDPNAPPEELAERIVKTLGFGAQIERRLGILAADWSANEFSTSQVIDGLEEQIRDASVVPLNRLEMQVHRAARGAAQTLGKLVDVVVLGDRTLDAAIERRLAPALIQIVRNAVDHGIEVPDERHRRGKPVRGTITIDVARTESTVRVTVSDDGTGIDFDGLRARLARERPGAETLDDRALLSAIFEHGVTARDEATSISGRGVGLDIVANEVAAAGGRVTAESITRVGTRFMITMPASLRMDVIIPVTAGRLRCAITARLVKGIVRVGEIGGTTSGPMVRVQLGGESARLVPVRSLAALLGDAGDPARGDAALILDHPRGWFALTVDGYDDPRPLVTAPVRDPVVRTPSILGVVPTPDGGVLLLVDVAALHLAVLRPTEWMEREATVRRHHILVVEDAPVARELLSGLLRSFGYRVSNAMDGQEGLAAAQRDAPDLILADIEMPIMDGLAMIEALREIPKLRDVPVVILTTHGEEAARERAHSLGVRKFLSKRQFVEAELHAIIAAALGVG